MKEKELTPHQRLLINEVYKYYITVMSPNMEMPKFNIENIHTLVENEFRRLSSLGLAGLSEEDLEILDDGIVAGIERYESLQRNVALFLVDDVVEMKKKIEKRIDDLTKLRSRILQASERDEDETEKP